MAVKTTSEIMEEKDVYVDSNVLTNADWTKKHDDFFNTQWVKVKDIKKKYSKLYRTPISYEDTMDKIIYRNALKDLMNELNLLGKGPLIEGKK